MSAKKPNEFKKAAAEARTVGFFGELWGFIRENKKWWLIPILLTMLLFALLIFLSGTGAAPFIYSLF